MEYIITQPASKTKHQLGNKFGGFYIADAIFLAAVLITTLIICIGWFLIFNLTVGFWITMAITATIGVLIAFIGILGGKTNNLNKKNYELLWIKIKHKGSNKDILFSDLAKYLGHFTIDNGVITFDSKIQIKLFKFSAPDLMKNTSIEIEKIIKIIANGLKTLKYNAKFIIVDEKIDINKNIENIDRLIKIETNPVKINELLKYKKLVIEKVKQSKNVIQKGYYLMLIADENNSIIDNLSLANFNLYQIKNINTILNMFNHFYLSASSDQPIFSEKFKDFLNHQQNSNIDFKKNYYTQNNEYHSVLNIYNYPTMNEACWFKKIAKEPNISIAIDVCPIDKITRDRLVQTQKAKVAANAAYIKNSMDTARYEFIAETINYLINEIVSGEQILQFCCINIVVHGKSLDELNLNKGKIIDLLKSENFECDGLHFRQKEAYTNLLKMNNAGKSFFLFNEMSNLSLAAIYPFSSTLLSDDYGIFLGIDKTNNSPVFLDLKVKEGSRNSHNVLVTGTTGSGKSFFLSYLLHYFTFNPSKVFLFDANHDYFGFQKSHDAKVVDIGGGKTNKINFLQCFNSEATRSSHISTVTDRMIKLLSINELYKAALIKLLNELFDSKKLSWSTNEAINIPNDEWPTLTDLKLVCKNLDIKTFDLTKDEYIQLKNLTFLLTTGIYDELWNGLTKFDIEKDNFIIFDTFELQKQEKKILETQTNLVFNFISSQCWINARINNKIMDNNLKKWVYVVADEAHRYLKLTDRNSLENFETTAREIRKFDGSLILATQNISDLLPLKAIMSNIPYRFLKQMSDIDFNAYRELVSEVREVTEAEKNELTLLMTKFDVMVNIGNKTSVTVNLPDLNEIKSAWKNEKSDIGQF